MNRYDPLSVLLWILVFVVLVVVVFWLLGHVV